MDADNESGMNFGYRQRIVCLLHGLAEGIWTCELDQINADPKGNWYRLTQKKIDQQIVRCSVCQNKNGPEGDKKFEDWKRR